MTGGPAAGTTAVAREIAVAAPIEFRAVRATRSVEPTSAVLPLYAWAVAPEMEAQFAPVMSHRCHWYTNLVGLFFHVPGDAVSV